jgi:AcrR family transcriptional regulator
MAKRTIDRRVARTRETLQRALISLILKKGYDAITVEDICEAANVGRSTFYSHYTSKDDLKRSGLEAHLRQQLVGRQKDTLALQLFFSKISESMGNHDSNIVDACSVD